MKDKSSLAPFAPFAMAPFAAIADLAKSEVIAVAHVAEAIQYRKLDRMA